MKTMQPQNSRRLMLAATFAAFAALVAIVPWRVVAQNAPPTAGVSPAASPRTTLGAPAPGAPILPPAKEHQFAAQISIPVVEIQSPVDGKLAQVLATGGQKVHKGELLIKLDDRAASAAMQIAQVNLRTAEQAMQANRTTVSPTETEQLRSQYELAQIQVSITRDALDDLQIRAPVDGVVQSVDLAPGQIVARGTRLTQIMQTGDIRVLISVPNEALADIHTGQKFTCTPRGRGAAPCGGEITFIEPTSDPNTQTFLARGKLVSGEPLDRFKSGMIVFVDLQPEP